jgi:hypothetical protein
MRSVRAVSCRSLTGEPTFLATAFCCVLPVAGMLRRMTVPAQQITMFHVKHRGEEARERPRSPPDAENTGVSLRLVRSALRRGAMARHTSQHRVKYDLLRRTVRSCAPARRSAVQAVGSGGWFRRLSQPLVSALWLVVRRLPVVLSFVGPQLYGVGRVCRLMRNGANGGTEVSRRWSRAGRPRCGRSTTSGDRSREAGPVTWDCRLFHVKRCGRAV